MMRFRAWVLQDWAVNAGRPESQLVLAWFRLAQWADRHWGRAARLVVTPYWLITSLFLGFELPVTATIGPRLRLYHRIGIVLNPHAVLGSDCHLRHGVTIGNKVDRSGRELGVASIGSDVDLGAGCVVIGDIPGPPCNTALAVGNSMNSGPARIVAEVTGGEGRPPPCVRTLSGNLRLSARSSAEQRP
jgi:putative colanic acid biosynthesis acetyltransferase WcaB